MTWFDDKLKGRLPSDQEGHSAFGASVPNVDLEAYKLALKVLPPTQYTEAERQYVLSVARGEGYYGKGWKSAEGKLSHNWGAVQGIGPAGSFVNTDVHASGEKYQGHFKKYHSDAQGLKDMADVLLKPNLRASLNKTKSLRKAVMIQHGNKYFELDPEKYLAAVKTNYQKVASNANLKFVLSERGKMGILATLGTLAVLGGAGFVGYQQYQKRAT